MKTYMLFEPSMPRLGLPGCHGLEPVAGAQLRVGLLVVLVLHELHDGGLQILPVARLWCSEPQVHFVRREPQIRVDDEGCRDVVEVGQLPRGHRGRGSRQRWWGRASTPRGQVVRIHDGSNLTTAQKQL